MNTFITNWVLFIAHHGVHNEKNALIVQFLFAYLNKYMHAYTMNRMILNDNENCIKEYW